MTRYACSNPPITIELTDVPLHSDHLHYGSKDKDPPTSTEPPSSDLDALCAKYGHLPVADALDAIERDARQMGIEIDREAIWRAATDRDRRTPEAR